MHFFRSHRERPNLFRGHARIELPLNPICWLKGHTPKIVIHESKYSEDYMWIECAVCTRRYRGDDEIIRAVKEDYRDENLPAAERRAKAHERAKAIARARIANARRDPKTFLRSIEDSQRRNGFAGATLELNLEAHWRGKAGLRKILEHAAVKLHLGNTSSETPIDGHIDIGAAAVYWSVGGIGGRFCEWIGRGQKRNLSLKVHGGTLWWELWHDDESGNAPDGVHRCDSWRRPKLWPWSAGRKKHRPWMCLRHGNIDLNPIDAFYGSQLWLKAEDFTAEPVLMAVEIGDYDGDTHLVDFTLEKREVRRQNGPAWARRVKRVDWTVDWSCKKGIPVRNHEWKGDEIYGSHVTLTRDVDPAVAAAVGPPPPGWVQHAVELLIAQVRENRKRYDYRPPKAAPAGEVAP